MNEQQQSHQQNTSDIPSRPISCYDNLDEIILPTISEVPNSSSSLSASPKHQLHHHHNHHHNNLTQDPIILYTNNNSSGGITLNSYDDDNNLTTTTSVISTNVPEINSTLSSRNSNSNLLNDQSSNVINLDNGLKTINASPSVQHYNSNEKNFNKHHHIINKNFHEKNENDDNSRLNKQRSTLFNSPSNNNNNINNNNSSNSINNVVMRYNTNTTTTTTFNSKPVISDAKSKFFGIYNNNNNNNNNTSTTTTTTTFTNNISNNKNNSNNNLHNNFHKNSNISTSSTTASIPIITSILTTSSIYTFTTTASSSDNNFENYKFNNQQQQIGIKNLTTTTSSSLLRPRISSSLPVADNTGININNNKNNNINNSNNIEINSPLQQYNFYTRDSNNIQKEIPITQHKSLTLSSSVLSSESIAPSLLPLRRSNSPRKSDHCHNYQQLQEQQQQQQQHQQLIENQEENFCTRNSKDINFKYYSNTSTNYKSGVNLKSHNNNNTTSTVAKMNETMDITHPSQLVYMSTTVPQNMKGNDIAGRHTPTRNSLRHSRMLVINKNFQGIQPQNPLGLRYPYLTKVLLIHHIVFGILLTCIGFWILLWAPNTRIQDNPYWSGITLTLAGILGLVVTRFKRMKRNKLRENCFIFLKYDSYLLTFLACILCLIAFICASVHLHHLSLSSTKCESANFLIENDACMCTFNAAEENSNNFDTRSSSSNNLTLFSTNNDETISSEKFLYSDLSCNEVHGAWNFILTVSVLLNVLGFCVTILYILSIFWKKRTIYTSVRTNYLLS